MFEEQFQGAGNRRVRGMLLLTGAVVLPMWALQAAPMEEIVVTAQKRAQNIQDVGIAITALSGDQIAKLGYIGSTDIARLVPGVHLGGSSGGQTMTYTIRGVAQNDFSDNTESPIAVYVDDTYVVLSQAQKFGMFDLDRLEVLKGPQGTLFGRNATGGLLHFVTRKPTRQLDGYLQAGFGSYDETRVQGAIGGPLTESISGRVSGLWTRNGSYLINDYDPNSPVAFNPSQALIAAGSGQDLGREVNTAVRGQLLFDLTDKASLWLGAGWSKSEASSPPYQSEATAAVIDAEGRQRNEIRQPADSTAQAFSFETGDPIDAGIFGPFPRPVPGGDATGYIDSDGLGWDHAAPDYSFKDLNRFEVWNVSAKLDWDFSGPQLTAISDYKNYDKKLGLDIDAAPMNQLDALHVTDVWQFSQEIRVAEEMERWRWVLGLYYLHADTDYMHGARVLDNGPLLLPPGTLAADYPTQVFQTTDNYSIFGQAEYDFTDTLTLVAGFRGMREEKDYDYALQVRGLPPDPRDEFIGPFIGIFSDVVGLPVSTETHQSSSDPLWAGKIQLDWRPSDNLLVYAGVNRGVKAGGFNNPVDFGATQLQPGFRYPYDPEELLAYEGGFKATLFNGTTRLNGSIYYYDYHNYQGFFYRGLSSTIVNYEATTTGGELELATTPLEGLDLMLSLALIDAKVKDVEVATDITEDTEPAFTPPLQFSAAARYAWPMLSGQVAIQGDVTYTDQFFYSIQNFTSHRLDSYWLADARLSWTSADDKWEFAGTVNNLTDEEYATHGFGVSLFCGCSEVGVGKPRWFGFEVTRNFRE